MWGISASIENPQALKRIMMKQLQLPLLVYLREQIDQYVAIESTVEVDDVQEETLSPHNATSNNCCLNNCPW